MNTGEPTLSAPSQEPSQALSCPQRHAMGEDPAKRAQILAGAGRVISRMGYDAASVNDIAREAGVSKGTIYVYFAGKEDLFEALMEETRERLFLALGAELEKPGPLRERLFSYASVLAQKLCSDPVIRAHRVMIGVAERMPELGARFYERGSTRGTRFLGSFLETHVAAGTLIIADVPLAASQFFELCMAGLFRRRLFAHMPEPPAPAEIDKTIRSAIDMFLTYYGAPGRT
ncbi:TetR family transcriptional regulator [bacterium]|nr:TetR family transcriptional regulator [bacterium]